MGKAEVELVGIECLDQTADPLGHKGHQQGKSNYSGCKINVFRNQVRRADQ